mmetsp:Transcript_99361/g.290009  ORF Transcript_99361/g.290009 Transcript_99361/m.290009 type:complete len:282 (+) Transcript_99361:11-856(+)
MAQHRQGQGSLQATSLAKLRLVFVVADAMVQQPQRLLAPDTRYRLPEQALDSLKLHRGHLLVSDGIPLRPRLCTGLHTPEDEGVGVHVDLGADEEDDGLDLDLLQLQVGLQCLQLTDSLLVRLHVIAVKDKEIGHAVAREGPVLSALSVHVVGLGRPRRDGLSLDVVAPLAQVVVASLAPVSRHALGHVLVDIVGLAAALLPLAVADPTVVVQVRHELQRVVPAARHAPELWGPAAAEGVEDAVGFLFELLAGARRDLAAAGAAVVVGAAVAALADGEAAS